MMRCSSCIWHKT